jgi:mannose-6-phosphate isomerase-like protein (cupin superfamily)
MEAAGLLVLRLSSFAAEQRIRQQADVLQSTYCTKAFAMQKISLDEKFALFHECWRPKTIAALNGQEVKLVKVKGEFPWHHHEREDEFFMVWKGVFRVEFRDQVVTLRPGECVVVPRGVEHRTCADDEAWILCFEPAETLNTGNIHDATYTAPRGSTI